jgi:iron complex transport system ATP-binding protein
MSDVLEFAGVSVVRGDNTLLDDITWEVEEGQRWVILGPNGAGKTTLLQLAAGRIHPTTGVAGVLGEVLGAVDVFELRPRIGLSSAVIADRLPADELVRDVVVTASYGVVGRWRETYDRPDHARAADLLDALGVAHLSERTFGTLSEGERKRVQIARALMTDPELMLLDEPAAGLDLGGREDLVARLGALAADVAAPALVLVTHHVEEIPPSFTDVLLMREGRIVAAGPVEITLTAANLSETFGLPLVVDRHGGRWSARAVRADEGTDPESSAPHRRTTEQYVPTSSTVLAN